MDPAVPGHLHCRAGGVDPQMSREEVPLQHPRLPLGGRDMEEDKLGSEASANTET